MLKDLGVDISKKPKLTKEYLEPLDEVTTCDHNRTTVQKDACSSRHGISVHSGIAASQTGGHLQQLADQSCESEDN